MKKTTLSILLIIFLLGYFLRVMYLPRLALTFGYDQARDAYETTKIISGHLKIQGPPASTPGLNHGVFYYYLLAPAYFFGQGSPIAAGYWIALINSLTVLVVFVLTYLMTKKVFAGFIAAFLFAVSFEATQYATWLSNPTTAILTVPLMYLGLWLWTNPEKIQPRIVSLAPIITAVGLGLSVQAEIFLLYQVVPVAIWLWITRRKITRKQVFLFVFFLGLTLSTYLAAEFKFGFRSLTGFKALALTQESGLAYAKSIGDYALLYLNQIGRIYAFNSYPGNIGYGGTLVIVLIVLGISKARKHGVNSPYLFLATWLLSHLSVVTLGGTSTPFLMVGIGPAVSVILAIYLTEWWSHGYRLPALIILVLLVYGNLAMIAKENPRGSTLFSIQQDMILAKQIQAVDLTYQNANGKPFSINTLTSPLWNNVIWSYLYNWYGKAKYGYLPQWSGRDTVGQLGDNLPKANPVTRLHFFIIEPQQGIPAQYLPLEIGSENAKSDLVSEISLGDIRVQTRYVKK